MKIIIKRESGKVTLETCEGSYPYQVRELIKNALILEGYAKEDIAEILNIQEDKVQPCCAEEEEVSETPISLERFTCMMFRNGAIYVPVIIDKIAEGIPKIEILQNVLSKLASYGMVGYEYLPAYDVVTNKGFIHLLENQGLSVQKPLFRSIFSNMEILIYPKTHVKSHP
jgi:hypothetical protein